MLLVAVTSFTLAVRAESTYVYTGNPFTFVNNGGAFIRYTTSDFLSGSFTIATLTPNLALGSINPTSYLFSDGTQTIHTPSPVPNVFQVATDGSGNISSWIIKLCGDLSCAIEFDSRGGIGTDFDQARSGLNNGGNTASPGSWVTNTVAPEPSTAALLLPAALIVVGSLVRRRRRKVAGIDEAPKRLSAPSLL